MWPDCGYGYFSWTYMSHNPALVSDPYTCIPASIAGSAHMIFIQVAGLCDWYISSVVLDPALWLAGIFRVFSRLQFFWGNQPQGTGCAFVIPRTCGTLNAPVRARRPDTRQALHGHAINSAPVHHYFFSAWFCACAKSPARNARRQARKVWKKEVLGFILRRNQSHSPCCIAIHCAQNSSAPFCGLFAW